VNFFLPLRAAQDPVINEGDPTCESFTGAATAVYTNGKAGCRALADNLQRVQYQKPPVTQRQAPFLDQLENYWQYFDWQWSRGVAATGLPGSLRTPFSLLFLGFGLLGLCAAWKADRTIFAYVGTLLLTLTLGLVFYLNFKYGYSLSPEVAGGVDTHEVRERDYFFIAGFLVWGVVAGVGIAWAWGRVATALEHHGRWAIASPVLLLAGLPLVLNWSWASRAGDYAANDWAYDLLMSVEPYAVLFTNGDNDTFPLWYMQEVEGVRRDVTVVVGQYLFTSWYPKQLRDLTAPDRQRPFDAPELDTVFEAPAQPPPRAVTTLTDAQMDGIGAARLDQDVTVPFPGLAVTYPSGMVLNRDAQIALAFIHDSIDERPIYFAASGGMMNDLGLDAWGVRHGLAVKLELRDLEGEQREGVVQGSPEYGGDYFDMPASLALYEDVYRFRSLRDRAVWADRSSLNIPWYYYVLALQLSDASRVAGLDAETVSRFQQDALAFEVVANGGRRGTPGEIGGDTPPT
jgi:hypothetical protein